MREKYRRVYLAVSELRKHFYCQSSVFVVLGGGGKSNEHFVHVQPRVSAAEIFYFEILNGDD